MIFVSVGSQKFQFNRLLKAIDSLNIDDEIFAQVGYSDYQPKNYKHKKFLNGKEFDEIISKSDIVITHGGAGNIVKTIKKGKKVIAIPRLAKFGEHVDNHQEEIISEFEKANYISACYDLDDLSKVIELTKNKTFNKYVSNTNTIIQDLEKYINES